MQGLLRAARVVDRVNRALGVAVGWLTLAMVLVGAYNALARALERHTGLALTSNAYVELQWYLFGLVFLLGAPYTLRAGAHVRVDVLWGGHDERGKAWVDLVGGVLLLVPFCLFAIWVSREFVTDSWAVREGSPDPDGLPRWPLKAVVPVAFALIALQGLSEIVKRAAILRGRSPEDVGLFEPSLRDAGPEEAARPGAGGSV